MTTEEKELLEKLLAKSKNISESEAKSEEPDDEVVIKEVSQAIEVLTFSIDLLKRNGTPGWVKRQLKNLWRHIKRGIANWLRDVACEIDPDC